MCHSRFSSAYQGEWDGWQGYLQGWHRGLWGDKFRTIEKIKKITSGSTPEVADIVDSVSTIYALNIWHVETKQNDEDK